MSSPPARAATSKGWAGTRLRDAPIHLEPEARAQLAEHLGQDVGRLPGLVDLLVSAYGDGARIGSAELGPFLGEAGAVAPWDLTDAIDRGDTEAALTALHRLLGAGERHPLVVLAVLHRHFSSVLRLDGATVSSETEAAKLLGIAKGRSTFPAKKALATARRLGSERVAEACSCWLRPTSTCEADRPGRRSWFSRCWWPACAGWTRVSTRTRPRARQ